MATDAQVSEWTQWGGTIEPKKGRGKANQVFVAPSGSWVMSTYVVRGCDVDHDLYAYDSVVCAWLQELFPPGEKITSWDAAKAFMLKPQGADSVHYRPHLHTVQHTGDNKENMTNKRQKTEEAAAVVRARPMPVPIAPTLHSHRSLRSRRSPCPKRRLANASRVPLQVPLAAQSVPPRQSPTPTMAMPKMMTMMPKTMVPKRARLSLHPAVASLKIQMM